MKLAHSTKAASKNAATFRSSALTLGYLPLAVGYLPLAIGYLLPPVTASAHPGHNFSDATPQHLLTSPDHLAVLALSGVVLWLAGRFVQRQLPRRLLQGAGFAAVVTAAVIWGIGT